MERNSTPKSIRTERIAASSPYARPSKAVKPKSSLSSIVPMGGLRSLYSYVTSSFTRQPALLPSNNGDLADDQRSESGSEDGWNGQPPATMNGDEDVFDAASAAGRQGDEFAARAAEWRARGERPGGRRELTRKGLLASTSTPQLATPGPGQPASTLQRESPQPEPVASTSGFEITNPRKRPLSPEFATASLRLPLPSSSRTPVPPSPSAEALKAFLAARHETSMTVQELRTFETLVDSIKSESSENGWSASSSLPPSRRLRRLDASDGHDFLTSTPRKQGDESEWSFTSGSSSPLFNVGADIPAASPSHSPAKNSRKILYLGPGMSPRRMLRRPQLEVSLESPKKKTKSHETSAEGSPLLNSEPTVSQSSNIVSVPSSDAGSSSNNKDRVNSLRTFAPSISSPLKASFTSSPASAPIASSSKTDPVSVGKRRAAIIMKELIESELGSGILSPSKDVSDFIVNPYDTTSSKTSRLPSGTSAPSTPTLGSRAFPNGRQSPSGHTPGRPTIRANTDSTPKRGAAARLAATKSTHKMTTLERLSGRRPPNDSATSSGSQGKSPELDAGSSEEDEGEEVDELFGSPGPETPGPAVKKAAASSPDHNDIPLPKPILGFTAPQFVSSTYSPLISSSTVAPSHEIYESPLQKAVLASTGSSTKARAVFTPTPVSVPIGEEEDFISSVESYPQTIVPGQISSQPVDPSAVFLSAKDAALAVAVPALPFFLFNAPSHDQLPLSNPVLKGRDQMPKPTKRRRRCIPSSDMRQAVLLKVNPIVFKFYNERGKFPSSATMHKLAGIRDGAPGKRTADNFSRVPSAQVEKETKSSEAPGPAEAGAKVSLLTQTDSSGPSTPPAPPPSGEVSVESTVADGLAKPPSAPSGGFSFGSTASSAASGPKPPAPPAAGFSFGAPSISTNGPKPPAPPSGGFSFGSAASTNGFKAPAPPAGGFSFGGAASSPSSSSSDSASGFTPTLPAPPAGGFSFGGPAPSLNPLTNPKAAGGAQWTCSVCMLQNPDSAKDKCQICEADRP